jgi:hypothetical protein
MIFAFFAKVRKPSEVNTFFFFPCFLAVNNIRLHLPWYCLNGLSLTFMSRSEYITCFNYLAELYQQENTSSVDFFLDTSRKNRYFSATQEKKSPIKCGKEEKMSENGTEEVDTHLKNLYEQNRTLSQPWYSVCILAYAILVVFAVSGNCLVLVALARSRELRKSARNILIGLLATSDLLLSCTMPLTAIDVLTRYWPFGKDTENLCRMVKTSSAVAVYLSSMTLTAIAVDRYHCIVQSSR